MREAIPYIMCAVLGIFTIAFLHAHDMKVEEVKKVNGYRR